jgi:hypothetical protein
VADPNQRPPVSTDAVLTTLLALIEQDEGLLPTRHRSLSTIGGETLMISTATDGRWLAEVGIDADGRAFRARREYIGE